MLARNEHGKDSVWPEPPPNSAPMPSFRCIAVDDDGYPHSDGVPIAENTRQFDEIHYAAGALKARYKQDADTFVASNLLLYYERGNRKASVAPDVFVAFGAGNQDRLSYKLWEERAAPCFALEVLSGSSVVRDMEFKRTLYAMLGIKEFWLFDPFGDFIEDQLLGFRLRDGVYEPIPPLAGGGGFPSAVLNLVFRNESGSLRIHDPVLGEDLKRLDEALESAREANASREQERQLRQQAEAQVADAEARAVQAEARAAKLEAMLRSQDSR